MITEAAKRVQLGMVVALAVGSTVPAYLAWTASRDLALLEASPVCADAAPDTTACVRELPVTFSPGTRYELLVRAPDGTATPVRLARTDTLHDALARRPDSGRARYFQGTVVSLDWGAGPILTEEHPSARRTWYASVLGGLWLLVGIALVLARRRR